MNKAQLFSTAIVMLFAGTAVQSQTSTQYDKGTPPQHAVGVSSLGSYISTELGTVNLSNGSLNFKIPIGTIGGRGMSLPLTLNYSSKVWSASIDTDFERATMQQAQVAYADYDRGLTEGGSLNTIIGAGWTIGALPNLEAKRVLIGRIPSGPNTGCYNYVLTKLTLYLPDRGEIEMRDDATDGSPLPATCPNSFDGNRGMRWHATDGSGIVFINDVNNGAAQWPVPNLSGIVITADGTRIRFGQNGSITDRNGNQITGFTDSLGRTVTVQHNVPDPENPGVNLRVLVTFSGYGGQNRYYKIKTGIMSQNYRSGINPNLPVITGDWDPEGWGYDWWGTPTKLFFKSYGLYAQRIDAIEVLTDLVLPDGRSLKFKYNQFGEVAEVELPTGGKIQYDYGYSSSLPTGNSPVWETGTGGTGGGITTDVKFVDRTVREKRTYPDGVTLEGKWNYSYGSTSASASVRSASDTLLSDTLHYFLPSTRYTEYPFSPGNHDGSHYTLWSTGVEWRAETLDANGVVISASEQDWSQRAPVSWPTYQQEQPANDNRVNQGRRYLETGAMSKVETFYDLFNNPTEVKEYDFDQSLKRRSVTTYSSTNLVNGVNYAADSIRMISLPLQQSIYDGAGVEQARTTYEYDIYAADGNHDSMLSYPSITGHDTANYGTNRTTRGNVTRIGNWIKTTGSYVYTYPRYDIAGNVVSMKDARGNVATVSFTDDFGNGSNPGGGVQGTYGPTYALPTLITSPPPTPGAPVHTARSQYDFSTGLLSGFKDRNGIVTQTLYNDPFNRPTQVNAALGTSVEARTRMYYANQTTEFGIVLAKNDVLTAVDQNSLDDKILRSWTKTDGFGRATESWSKDPQGDVKVTTVFDAFGRSKQVSNPYRPSLGETPVYTTSAYDLAGRVTSVATPDNAVVSTSYSGNTVTVTDQAGKARKSVTDALGRLIQVYEDPNGLNYLTSYSYDTLDNLITVNQGSQTRTFVYDSLKRLTSATNPESSTVTYSYDENGNLKFKTDARGVITELRYDALNRPTTKLHRINGQPDPTTGDVEYLYDNATNGKGRPWLTFTWGANPFQTAVGSYDALGRVTQLYRQFGNGQGGWLPAYSVGAAYDLAGNLKTMTYPSGRTITNTFDGAGRLSSFTGYLGDGTQRTYASGISYSPFGGMKWEQYGTDTPLYHKTFYNIRGQMFDTRVSSVNDTWDWNRGRLINYYSSNHQWGGSGTDNNGNVMFSENWIPPANATLDQAQYLIESTYSYDSLNRLSAVSEQTKDIAGGGNWTPRFAQANTYDRWGNRSINATGTWGGVNNNQAAVVPNTSTNRMYAPGETETNHPLINYDAAGNQIKDYYTDPIRDFDRTYDAENKLKVSTAYGPFGTEASSYTYDGDGRRTKRIVNGIETWQVYGLGGELLAEYAATAAATNPQKEYGYRNGELLVTTETSSSGGGGSAQPVIWTNAVGVSVSGNNLTKTAAEAWGNAGASSTQSIASGDGYVETTMSETNKYRMIGLSNGDSNQHYPDIDFAFYPAIGGTLYVYEGGVSRGTFGTYATGDVLRVAIEGGVVKYRKNGTLLYTSTVSPTYPLLVDTAFYSIGSTISNAMISTGSQGGGSSTQNASWANSVGVAVNGNNLTKTAAEGWGNAGASSTQSIASGDGYVETTISETNKYRMIGLSNGDSNQHYPDIDFAVYPAVGGTLYVYEGGVSRGTFGTYASGDVLRVAIEGGVVKYRKNGTLLYTSTVAPTYPLLVDTSLYSNGATLNNVVISGGGGGSSTQIRWLVTDHLGTPRMVFDQTGSLANVSRHDYLPFGEELYAGTGGRTTGLGYTASDNVRQKFTLKERDNETGLDYFLARYYSSTQGRFTSPDEFTGGPDELFYFAEDASANPTFYSDLLKPQSLNKYQYAYNNPLKYVDPDGHCPECAEAVIKVGVATQVAPLPVPVKVGAAVVIVGAVIYLYSDEIAEGAKAGLNWARTGNTAADASCQGCEGSRRMGQSLMENSNKSSSSQDAGKSTQGSGQAEGGLGNNSGDQNKKGGSPKPKKERSAQGAQTQREDISAQQAAKRKRGQGESINSIEKSNQNEKTELKRLKNLGEAKEKYKP